MLELTIWKNQEIDRLRRDMDRLFARLWDDFGMPSFPRIAKDIPSIDLSESEDKLIINVEIPGINPEDLDISVTEDRLHITGEMKQESVDNMSPTTQKNCHQIQKPIKRGSLNIFPEV